MIHKEKEVRELLDTMEKNVWELNKCLSEMNTLQECNDKQFEKVLDENYLLYIFDSLALGVEKIKDFHTYNFIVGDLILLKNYLFNTKPSNSVDSSQKGDILKRRV